MTDKTLLIDADIIAYSVGFAANEDPVEFALHSVKIMIESMLDATGCEEYECFLTGTGNYRTDVATIKPYKGNRKQDKPVHFQAIRDYLVNVHGAEVVDGMEADDALGINQTKDTIIASIDKDLDMVEGLHYNWRKGDLYYVTKEEGRRNFYRQLLTGDSTDNIVGIPGIGPKKAEAILDTIEDQMDLWDIDDWEEEAFWTVLEVYSLHYPEPYAALMETADLIYIQQGSGRWEPPV
jgi:DNA polymerase-1